VTQAQAQINDWHAPSDLGPAVFEVEEPIKNTPPPKTEKALINPNAIDKLIPLIGKMNNGGFDITSVVDLLDKSGQGFGALGKLLPVIAPLIQNGNFGNLFSKKKSMNDIIDYDTINLDN